MKEIFIINGLVEERTLTSWDYFQVGHKYIVMEIREDRGFFKATIQDLDTNAVFKVPLQTLERSKGNYAVAVFRNHDVALFDTVFTMDNKTSTLATLADGTHYQKKKYTFTFLYEL